MRDPQLTAYYFSIYAVHDELKDKEFELELTWVSAGALSLRSLILLVVHLLFC